MSALSYFKKAFRNNTSFTDEEIKDLFIAGNAGKRAMFKHTKRYGRTKISTSFTYRLILRVLSPEGPTANDFKRNSSLVKRIQAMSAELKSLSSSNTTPNKPEQVTPKLEKKIHLPRVSGEYSEIDSAIDQLATGLKKVLRESIEATIAVEKEKASKEAWKQIRQEALRTNWVTYLQRKLQG